MTVITVTGEVGSFGDIPTTVGKFLGCRVVDRQIPQDLARQLGWSTADVAALDERVGGFLERLARSFETFGVAQANGGLTPWSLGGVSQWPIGPLRTVEDRYITALRDRVIEYASTGDIVIVGRGAAAILAEWPSALHVRLDCPFDVRVGRVAMRNLLTGPEAEHAVKKSDAQREAWHRRYFAVGCRTPYLYDLTLNTERMPDAQAAEVICHAAGVVGLKYHHAGKYVHIPAGVRHRIAAAHGDVNLFEKSTLELDDVVRLADDYGRTRERIDEPERRRNS